MGALKYLRRTFPAARRSSLAIACALAVAGALMTAPPAQAADPPLCERSLRLQAVILELTSADDTCENFPDSALNGVGTLDASNRGIGSLKPGDFHDMPNLTTLNLSGNLLKRIRGWTFGSLRNLDHLNLSNNQLERLSPDAFRGLVTLDTLNLSHNHLRTLPRIVPSRLELISLLTLDLSHNQLERLSGTTFSWLDDLQVLDLSYNNLPWLPGSSWLDNLDRLQVLNLGHNRLTGLREDPFRSVAGSLRQLLLNDNQLTYLPSKMFRRMNLGPKRETSRDSVTGQVIATYRDGALRLDGNPGADFRIKSYIAHSLKTDPDDDSNWLLKDTGVITRFALPFAVNINWTRIRGEDWETLTDKANSAETGDYGVRRGAQVSYQGSRSINLRWKFSSVRGLSDSRCGFNPCYAGFVVGDDDDNDDNDDSFYHDGNDEGNDNKRPRIRDAVFTSAPADSARGYVAGEEVVVEVRAGAGWPLPFFFGEPWLELRIGNKNRRANWVPAHIFERSLRFSYRIAEDDDDGDGIEIRVLKRNGADIRNSHRERGDFKGDKWFSKTDPAHKVQRRTHVSFNSGTVSVSEGRTIDLEFRVKPAARSDFTVGYELHHDGAGSGDFTLDPPPTGNRGEVRIRRGAESGRIRVAVSDDEDIESARESFRVRLTDSNDYVLTTHPEIRVEIKEGVCDRTPEVRDALMEVTERGHCADVTNEDLAATYALDLSGLGIDSLKSNDFLGLEVLTVLDLRNNRLERLPHEIFHRLPELGGEFGSLRLDGNPVGTFDFGVEIVGTTYNWRRQEATFRLHFPHGALFDWAIPASIQGYTGSGDTAKEQTLMISRGAVHGLTYRERHSSGAWLEVRLDELPALPPAGDSGCGRAPCYSGFRFSLPPRLEAPDNPSRRGFILRPAPHFLSVNRDYYPAPGVSEVNFNSPSHRDGYVAGVDTIEVTVVFDREFVLRPSASGRFPSLELILGNERSSVTRVADYAPTQHLSVGRLMFRYALDRNDEDDNGVAVHESSLQWNGARTEDQLGRGARGTFADRFTGDRAGHKVQTLAYTLAFEDDEVFAAEGSSAELPFTIVPPAFSETPFGYVVSGPDTAYSGVVRVATDDERGVVSVEVGDDDEIEALVGGNISVSLTAIGDYRLVRSDRVTIRVQEGVCDRTPQVRDALTTAAGAGHCAEVSTLSGVSELDLNPDTGGEEITALKPRDFADLDALQRLFLSGNALRTLPAGVFAGLGALVELRLDGNRLSELPAGLFADLGALEALTVSTNSLTALAPRLFAGLGALTELRLGGNRLRALSASAFADLQNAAYLDLRDNELSELPAGFFSVLPGLRALHLGGNSPINLTLGFELVSATGADAPSVVLEAALREGAPYPLTAGVAAAGGAVSPDSAAIPMGGTRSAPLVSTPAGMMTSGARMVVSFSSLSAPPADCDDSYKQPPDDPGGACFSGFAIDASARFTFDTSARADPSVCDRTPQIRDAILEAVGIEDCAEVSAALLAAVTHLRAGTDLTTFRRTDFNDLDALERLDLSGNEQLTTVGERRFAGLESLRVLDLSGGGLGALGREAFEGLANLEQLYLHGNDLETLPAGIFAELAGLGAPGGGLRLDGNLGGEDFVLAAGFEVERRDSGELAVHLSLAEGAPFDASFPLSVEGASSTPPDALVIPAGETRSETLTLTHAPRRTLTLRLGDAPSPPRGDSGCGLDPCYGGFAVAPGAPLVYESSRMRQRTVRVAAVEFISAPRYERGRYIAGLEEIVVNVTFGSGLDVDVSDGAPRLRLNVGGASRYAEYVPQRVADDELRFRHELGRGDSDDDGVGIYGASALDWGSARVTDKFGGAVDRSLVEFLDPATGHKVGQKSLLSLAASGFRAVRDSSLDLRFELEPAPLQALTVGYAVGAPGDTADAADYTDPGGGEVRVAANAPGGAVSISLEPEGQGRLPSERLTVSLLPSDRYVLIAPTAATVVIVEQAGVCGRTRQVRDALVAAVGAAGCAGVTAEMLSGVTDLDLSSTEIATLHPRDFTGLDGLLELDLQDNDLRTLPPGVFDELGTLTLLDLSGNGLTRLPGDMLSGTGNLARLYLQDNELRELPVRMFVGVAGLTNLDLSGNPGAPFALETRFEFPVGSRRIRDRYTGDYYFNFTAPDGAPYKLDLRFEVTGNIFSSSLNPAPTGASIGRGGVSTNFHFNIIANRGTAAVDVTGINTNGNFVDIHAVAPADFGLGNVSIAESISSHRFKEALRKLWAGTVLSGFPRNAFQHLTHLKASAQENLTVVERNDFRRMDRLRTVDLSDNLLSELDADAWRHITDTLEELDLSGNDGDGGENPGLTELGENSFGTFARLRGLDVSAGALQTLHPRTFAGLRGSLKRLRLDDNRLSELPAGIFEGLAGLGGNRGSLRLEGNLQSEDGAARDFTFTAEFRLASFDDDEVEFYLYLAQGAPFDLEIPVTAEGLTSAPPEVIKIAAGNVRSDPLAAAFPSGGRIRLSLGEPPSPPPGNSGCGYDPCYDGFGIASGADLVYDGSTAPAPARVGAVEFVSEPRSVEGYIAGGEAIVVEVRFDAPVAVLTTAGEPSLELTLGETTRTATFTSHDGNALRFRYATALDDRASSGVAVAAGDGLKLNGAEITGALGIPAELSLAGFLGVREAHRVRGASFLSFSDAAVSQAELEGRTVRLPVTLTPAPSATVVVVDFVIGVLGDSADAGDYELLPGEGISTATSEVEFPPGTASREIGIRIGDDDEIEATRESFTVSLLSATEGYNVVAPDDATVIIREGVCDRTRQVRDEIVERVANISVCEGITDVHLAEVDGRLDLDGEGISALKQKDFAGLARVEELFLYNNALGELPAGVFAGLARLRDLRLENNLLAALPASIFAGLGELRELRLYQNRLSELPANVFAGLARLRELRLDANRLAALPANVFAGLGELRRLRLDNNRIGAIPPGTFRPLARLRSLRLERNDLASLPERVFEGLDLGAADGSLRLRGNPNDDSEDMVLLADLRRVRASDAGAEFAVSIAQGAPFDVEIPLVVRGAGGLSLMMRVPAGEIESAPVILTSPEDSRLTFRLGEPPLLPPGGCGEAPCYGGFEIVSSEAVFANSEIVWFDDDSASAREGSTLELGVNMVPPLDRDFFFTYGVGRPGDTASAGDDYQDPGRGRLRMPRGDIKATIRVTIRQDTRLEAPRETLTIFLSSAPEGYALVAPSTVEAVIAEGVCDRTPRVREALVAATGAGDCADVTAEMLSGVASLDLSSTGVGSLQSDDFLGLDGLQALDLSGNALRTLRADVFDGLGALTTLALHDNRLGSLPEEVFDGLGALTALTLHDNQLRTLPEEVFDGLAALTTLSLHDNRLNALEENVFDDVEALTALSLENNELRELPGELFADLAALETLTMSTNLLTTLDGSEFAGLGALTTLDLRGNRLETLPPDVFGDLAALTSLQLQGNRLEDLEPGAFSGLGALTSLQLHGNRLQTLPTGLFSGLSNLERLFLHDNDPPGMTSGGDFRLLLRVEFADGAPESPPQLTAGTVINLKAVVREGAPYALSAGLTPPGNAALSVNSVSLPAGGTQSAEFTLTVSENTDEITMPLGDPSDAPVACPAEDRRQGACFSGVTVVSLEQFVLNSSPPGISSVRITSTPVEEDTYSSRNPEDLIVVTLDFDEEVLVVPAEDGRLPALALRIGETTQQAVYDAAISTTDRLAFSYRPQGFDEDADGISIPAAGLMLREARIVDLSDISVTSDTLNNLPGLPDDPKHKVERGSVVVRVRVFLEGALE